MNTEGPRMLKVQEESSKYHTATSKHHQATWKGC